MKYVDGKGFQRLFIMVSMNKKITYWFVAGFTDDYFYIVIA
jgi:hypothetical protein